MPGHPTRSPFLPSSLFALTCITTPHTTLSVSSSYFVGHAMVLCLSYMPSNKIGQARLKDFWVGPYSLPNLVHTRPERHVLEFKKMTLYTSITLPSNTNRFGGTYCTSFGLLLRVRSLTFPSKNPLVRLKWVSSECLAAKFIRTNHAGER